MNRLQQLLNLIFLPLVIIGAVFLVKGWIAGKPERVVKKPPVVVPRAEIRGAIQRHGNADHRDLRNDAKFL